MLTLCICISIPALVYMCAFCAYLNPVVSLLTVSVTSWRLSRLHGHSRSLSSLLLIQPASTCSPTQFAIKTKFRALKPEGRWVSAQGTCCLATGGGGGWCNIERCTWAVGGDVRKEFVCVSVCVSVKIGHKLLVIGRQISSTFSLIKIDSAFSLSAFCLKHRTNQFSTVFAFFSRNM